MGYDVLWLVFLTPLAILGGLVCAAVAAVLLIAVTCIALDAVAGFMDRRGPRNSGLPRK